jgi:hypothetical protein
MAHPFGRVLAQTASDAQLATIVGVLLVVVFIAALLFTIFVAIWINKDAKRRGANGTNWTLGFVLASVFLGPFVGGLVVLVIYVLTRPREIKFDAAGMPVIPTVPPSLALPPMGSAAPAGEIGTRVAPTPQAYAPAQGPVTKVKCPRCQTIFQYQKSATGLTHVKCPACGEEGNI